MGSSVAHDSNSRIVVVVSDEEICNAANIIIEHRGGLSFIIGNKMEILPLAICGLMSNENSYIAA